MVCKKAATRQTECLSHYVLQLSHVIKTPARRLALYHVFSGKTSVYLVLVRVTAIIGESAGADKAVVQSDTIKTFNDLYGKAVAYSDGSVSEYTAGTTDRRRLRPRRARSPLTASMIVTGSERG